MGLFIQLVEYDSEGFSQLSKVLGSRVLVFAVVCERRWEDVCFWGIGVGHWCMQPADLSLSPAPVAPAV